MNEDAQTEFKRELTKDCMKTVVAFSNTAGGIMYIGIDDNGTPVGVEDIDSVSLKTVQLLSDTIRPDVKMTTSVDNIEMDGKNRFYHFSWESCRRSNTKRILINLSNSSCTL